MLGAKPRGGCDGQQMQPHGLLCCHRGSVSQCDPAN
jgi:hypothetical protein